MYLLTGATGFLGPHILLQLLQKKEKVRVFRRPDTNTASLEDYFRKNAATSLLDSIEWVSGDLRDPLAILDAMNGISHVIHAAGFISFDPRDRQKLFDINMKGTANVVNAALACQVKKLLYVSSVAALGAARDEVMTEKTSWKDSPLNTVYGNSKYAGEREVWRGMEEGLNVIIIEPSLILGFGDTAKGGPTICRRVKNGLRHFPSGSHGYVGTQDVARAAVMLIDSDRVNEKFIVSEGNYGHREILDRIAIAVESSPPTVEAKTWMLAIAWRWEWIVSRLAKRKARMTRELANTMQSDLLFSGVKILEIKGFEYTPIEQAIAEMAEICNP